MTDTNAKTTAIGPVRVQAETVNAGAPETYEPLPISGQGPTKNSDEHLPSEALRGT